MSNTIVIIPHYNNPKGLIKSIESIQKDEIVDVLIIDDGSNIFPFDETAIKNAKLFDGQIYFIINKYNRGIEHVLNDGLDFALINSYTYIARLDCGDLCINNRFEKQISFLEKNSDISLLGSNVDTMDEDGNFLYTIKMPTTDNKIRKGMLMNAMFIHPTVIFRAEIVDAVGKYPINYKSAEDFAFFTTILKHYKGANINESLVIIELNNRGISVTARKKQVESRIRVLIENYHFGFRSTYGIIRSYILYYTPYTFIQKIKKLLYKR